MLCQRELDVPAAPAFLFIPRHPIREDHLPDTGGVGGGVGDGVDFPFAAVRGFGNTDKLPQVGFIPSRSRDDASFVIVAPPLKEGGEYRVVARYKWLDKSYIWQAERIRELVGRYTFRHIGVDVTGPGIGVFEQIRTFFPLATPINYSVQLKTQLVLKAKELIEAHSLKWDAGQNDIAHAFLTIRQGITDSGQISYSASRTSATGHADVAWSIMHALATDYTVFANAYLLLARNWIGEVVAARHLPAINIRRMKEPDRYGLLLPSGQFHEFEPGEVLHLKNYDVSQTVYGLPGYLGAIQSMLLNEDATLFRRRYYKNGAHIGYIFYSSSAQLE